MSRLATCAGWMMAWVSVACGSGEVDGSRGAAGSAGTTGLAGASGGGAAGSSAGSGGGASTVVIETFGTNLFGADAEYEAERRPALAKALAASDADVLCVTDVLREEDKTFLSDAAKGAFPYAFWVTRDASSQPDDPTLADGSKPPPLADPPCTTKDQLAAIEAGIACAEMSCSSIPSDPSGHVSSLDCVTTQCSAPLVPLVASGSAADRRCISCFEANLTSYRPWAEIQDKCTTQPTAGFVFDGQTDTVLLSRRPFVPGSTSSTVLPSSLFRRDILRARLDTAGGLDVYCVHLQTVFVGSLVVYPGQYAGGQVGSQAWAAENRLQATRLIDTVAKGTPTGPAVVVGNLESSQAVTVGGALVVSANGGAATLDLLTPTPFQSGVSATYVPACTECSENVLAQIAPPGMWTERVLLYRLDPSVVVSTSRGLTAPVVSVVGPKGATVVPLSSHFSFRSVLQLK